MPEDKNTIAYFERIRLAMETERSSFIPHYQELSQFVRPRRGRFSVTDRNKGDKRHQSIINSKATQAQRKARAGMLAGTMSAARPWFRLDAPDPDLMEFAPVRVWLAKAERLMRAILNQSNFYGMASSTIDELLLFATGAICHADDFQDVARFYSYTAGSYSISQNERYEVDTFARHYEAQVSQLVSEFGLDNVSQSVKTAYDNGNYGNWFPVVHLIEPNHARDDTSPLSSRKAFRSVYYEPGGANTQKSDGNFLRQKGFDEFPVYVPRWDVTGEDIYGTDCPGMTALGDIKGLQIQERRKGQGLAKMVSPPLHGPASLRNTPVSGLPGGLTTYDGDATKNRLEAIYTVNLPIQELVMDMEKVERRIDEAYYVDMFMAISSMQGIQPKNEMELFQRDQERLLQIGPVLENLHGGWLSPLIDRLFNQCVRANLLPPAPPELQKQELKVEYISTLAMAQRSVAAGGIDRLVAFVGGLKGAMLTDGKKFDGDQAIDEMAQIVGVPPRLIRGDDEVQAERQAEQQAAQQERMMALAGAAANTAKDASAAKTGDDSVLTSLAKVAGGKK